MKLQLRDVSAAHPGVPQRNVIEDVNCTFAEGELVLLVGATGAGKSTLLQLLAGLIKPTAGAVLYDGQSIWKGSRVIPDALLHSGMVFQSPEQQLFARTVTGEFRYSLRPYHLDADVARQRIHSALEQIGLPGELLPASPHLLSGGQKRRVALASTLSTEPDWLFLDEPSAGLDTQGVAQLQALLSRHILARQKTGGIVIATHDLDSFFPMADRVVLMVNGKIVAIDTPASLCQQPGLLLGAGVGLPAPAQIALAVKEAGQQLADIPFRPALMANALLQAKAAVSTPPERALAKRQTVETRSVEAEPEAECHARADKGKSATSVTQQTLIRRIDARAKWVAYLLLSIGVFTQQGTVGLVVATLLIAVLMAVSRVTPRPFIQVMKPFLVLLCVSVALSGLRFGHSPTFKLPVYYSIAEGWVTFHALYKVFLVMVLGVLFSTTTSQLQMKDGLQRSLSILSRLRLPVEAFALGSALVLRFIPVIMQDLQRFSAIVRARGKSSAKPGVLRVRDVPAFIIPLILSVFQLGENLSLAMEARGYTQTGTGATTPVLVKLIRRDFLTMFSGILLLGVLWVIRQY